ncbi:hypothetical protein [Nocardioides sp. W7]|uniref:hypothetical protein n=1 Tax=Nocardioides sp. W7 TaxID=2931390 RepID=UPI001FD3E34B|nr:hypothetical protein [Nocardioides sp. W7]
MSTVVTISQLPEVMVMKQQRAVRRRTAHALTPEERAQRLAELRHRYQVELERDARSLR